MPESKAKKSFKQQQKESWRTTVIGVVTGAIMLGEQIIAFLDSDPATTTDFQMVAVALAAMGIGTLARDKGDDK